MTVSRPGPGGRRCQPCMDCLPASICSSPIPISPPASLSQNSPCQLSGTGLRRGQSSPVSQTELCTRSPAAGEGEATVASLLLSSRTAALYCCRYGAPQSPCLSPLDGVTSRAVCPHRRWFNSGSPDTPVPHLSPLCPPTLSPAVPQGSGSGSGSGGGGAGASGQRVPASPIISDGPGKFKARCLVVEPVLRLTGECLTRPRERGTLAPRRRGALDRRPSGRYLDVIWSVLRERGHPDDQGNDRRYK